MGSWGFDVNRSTNGQISSNNNNNYQHQDQQTIDRISSKGYTQSFAHRSSSPPPSRDFVKISTPTLTRQPVGKEFSAVDRLVRGPHRIVGQTEFNPSNESLPTAMNSIQPHRIQAEQELLAWQNRMIERSVSSRDFF